MMCLKRKKVRIFLLAAVPLFALAERTIPGLDIPPVPAKEHFRLLGNALGVTATVHRFDWRSGFPKIVYVDGRCELEPVEKDFLSSFTENANAWNETNVLWRISARGMKWGDCKKMYAPYYRLELSENRMDIYPLPEKILVAKLLFRPDMEQDEALGDFLYTLGMREISVTGSENHGSWFSPLDWQSYGGMVFCNRKDRAIHVFASAAKMGADRRTVSPAFLCSPQVRSFVYECGKYLPAIPGKLCQYDYFRTVTNTVTFRDFVSWHVKRNYLMMKSVAEKVDGTFLPDGVDRQSLARFVKERESKNPVQSRAFRGKRYDLFFLFPSPAASGITSPTGEIEVDCKGKEDVFTVSVRLKSGTGRKNYSLDGVQQAFCLLSDSMDKLAISYTLALPPESKVEYDRRRTEFERRKTECLTVREWKEVCLEEVELDKFRLRHTPVRLAIFSRGSVLLGGEFRATEGNPSGIALERWEGDKLLVTLWFLGQDGKWRGETREVDQFGYNARYELTSASLDGTDLYAYAYDAVGNRVSATETTNSWAYAAHALIPYTSIIGNDDGTFIPEYDEDGHQPSAKPEARPTGDRGVLESVADIRPSGFGRVVRCDDAAECGKE